MGMMLGLLVAVTPTADDVLTSLRSGVETFEPLEPCSVTVSYNAVTDGEREEVVERFDHRAGAWMLMSEGGETPDAERLADYAEETVDREPPIDFYARSVEFTEYSLVPVAAETTSPVIFEENDLPRGALEVNGRDLSRHAHLSLHVDPASSTIVRDVMTSKSKFRIPLVARVDSFLFDRRYRLEPGYGMVVDSVHTTFKVDALGNEINAEMQSTYSDYDCPAGD